MASGKKGKKNKGVTVPLTDFLQETVGSLPSQPIRKSTKSWADEIDDYDAVDPKTVNMVLPTAPKASRDFDDIANKVPMDPPFMAYLSNLPYDVEDDEIADFFKNLKISRMVIPKEERSGELPKLKGYGYVEFEDRESLMSALIIPDTTLKNRRIRIEVAANADNDRRRGGRMGMGDRMGSADTGGDWRSSTNRPEPADDRRGGGGGFSREGGGGGFTRESSGASFTREGMREGGAPASRDRDFGGFSRDREGGGGGGFNRDRDFGRDRDSGFSRDRDGGGSGFSRNREQDDRPGAWRDGERDRGFSSRPSFRDSDRNRDDRDRDDRDRRGGGFRRYDDKEERNGGFTRSSVTSNREDKDDRDQETTSSSDTRQRPKLQLAPRTKPHDAKTEPAVPSASIFGSAKPVDTAERERQVEEKLLKQQEERLSESTRDRKDWGSEEGSEKRNLERGRPRKDDRDEQTNKTEEINSRDRGPPSRERRDASGDDNRKPSSLRGDKSPDKKQPEKQDKPKQEEKRGKPEIDMPKFQEPEPPNFQGSNKYALLDDNSD